MYRRSSREKGYYLVETAGVWKSAAIRQTSLAPANYLKPPLYTPAPTPTISFPKSVARIIKLVEESSGEDFFPCHPPLSCNHPPFSSFLLSASSTYAPPRPSDSISPLSPFSLFLSFLQFFPFVFRLSSNFDVSLFSISIFVFTYLTLISLYHPPAIRSSFSFSSSLLFLLLHRSFGVELGRMMLRSQRRFGFSVTASHADLKSAPR